ncbi:MAG: threonine synthase [Planctomycetes bacterium]|nr:threonine synthase [Planctomycetota bacterium]
MDRAFQQCVLPACGETYGIDEILFACRACGSLIDVRYDWSRCEVPKSLTFFDGRRGATGLDASGVWRFRELLPFAEPEDLVTVGEGRTLLQQADELAGEIGVRAGRLFLQYEGFNPSGSFKDNGMAAALTMARRLNRTRVACASTGNTSASLALFAGVTRTRDGDPIEAIVFVGSGKIAAGKLAQALDYGARTIQVEGDFDACMTLVQEATERLGLYLVNSVNPFRLEGQKTIMVRVLEGLGWEVPDWIVVPGGNLGNTGAFGKAFVELRELGLIDRLPRLAVINAAGANTLCELYNDRKIRFNDGTVDRVAIDAYYAESTASGRSAKTVASAIEIGRPVNLVKALRSLEAMNGVVRQVSDEAILDGKALVGRFGYGCEPASGATLAGLRLLMDEQVIERSDRVVCILTGHGLKDATATIAYHAGAEEHGSVGRFANPPVSVPADIEAIADLLEKRT